MSRSNSRRPTTHSRGSSSQGHRSLSVTEALQNIRFTEPVSEHPVGLSPSYATSSGRRRGSHRDDIAHYEDSPEPLTSYASYTLDPSVLESSPSYSHPSYSDLPPSTTSPYPSSSATMSYPSYTQAPLSNPYQRQLGSSRSPNYGKSAALTASDSHSCRPLNEAGYLNPRTEASMSRSMSGPSLPSVSPSAYEEVRSVGRDFVERRRHNVHRPRRQRKIIMRQVLPSTMRASKAEDMSGSIDSFLAHSSSSYDCPSPYLGSSSHHAHYGGSSSRYDTSLTPSYTSGSGSTSFTSSSRGYPAIASTTSFDYGGARRAPGNGTENPVVLEGPPSKPQCWDHGCSGRQFSTFSNLLRHQREKSGSSAKSICHRCGAEFTRKTARDGHLAHDKCKQKSPAR